MKITRGRAAAAAAALVLTVLCMFWINIGLNYNVRADNSNLAERALQFLHRGEPVPEGEEVRVYDSVTLGKERFALVEYVQSGEAQLGMIRMMRGLNGGYRIDSIGSGGGNFREEVVEANYQKYYLFGGRNAFFDVAEASIVLEGRKYTLDIPAQDHFLVCIEIDYTIRDTHCDLERLKFYNRDGREITDQVPWN